MASPSNQVPIVNEADIRQLQAKLEDGFRYILSTKSDDESTNFLAILKKIKDDISDLCRKHPLLATFILAALAGLAVAAIIPVLLELAGFSLIGPVEGSFAAAWQASIGDVAAGSFFAWLQSIGMAPAMAMVTGGLVTFAGVLWVELSQPVVWGPAVGDGGSGNGTAPGHSNSGGLGRRALNPFRTLCDGYRVVRYGFNGKTRFRG
ncbi:hypothetical protein TWF730_009390 [Orbilia blumenaviensis]|uniref:Uncharacterized protein n=1 Tax=Orbilia blumenaviensis TaxID=1796055 RepID=A0AAV9UY68_9PEZI